MVIFTLLFRDFGSVWKEMKTVLFLVENLEHNDFVALRNMLLRYDLLYIVVFVITMYFAF